MFPRVWHTPSYVGNRLHAGGGLPARRGNVGTGREIRRRGTPHRGHRPPPERSVFAGENFAITKASPVPQHRTRSRKVPCHHRKHATIANTTATETTQPTQSMIRVIDRRTFDQRLQIPRPIRHQAVRGVKNGPLWTLLAFIKPSSRNPPVHDVQTNHGSNNDPPWLTGRRRVRIGDVLFTVRASRRSVVDRLLAAGTGNRRVFTVINSFARFFFIVPPRRSVVAKVLVFKIVQPIARLLRVTGAFPWRPRPPQSATWPGIRADKGRFGPAGSERSRVSARVNRAAIDSRRDPEP